MRPCVKSAAKSTAGVELTASGSAGTALSAAPSMYDVSPHSSNDARTHTRKYGSATSGTSCTEVVSSEHTSHGLPSIMPSSSPTQPKEPTTNRSDQTAMPR